MKNYYDPTEYARDWNHQTVYTREQLTKKHHTARNFTLAIMAGLILAGTVYHLYHNGVP